MIEVLRGFDTDNPYLQRVFAHPRFGDVSQGCRAAMDGLSNVDPDEKVLAGERVNHGLGEQGFLILTTHFLRYVKAGRMFTVVNKNDLWSLEAGAELNRHANLGIITTASGDNFQFQGRSRKNAKEFFELYQLAQLALRWDENQRRHLHDVAATSLVEAAAATASAPSAPMKICPRCAEDVKSAALVCRYCGHEFEETNPETTANVSIDPRPVESSAAIAEPTIPQPNVYEGEEISNIVTHAFGVKWGKTPHGQTVFKNKEEDQPWILFRKDETSLVPPNGY
jgi:hypothetical protein